MIQANISQPIQTLIADIANQLCDTYCDKPLCQQYAWWVLESITHTTKSRLLMQSTITLTDVQTNTLHSWIGQQQQEKIPLQYLIGSVPFAECEIIVEPPILIPRPETEEWAMELIKKIKKSNASSLRILDLGTGSGCIAIALARALPDAQIYASDISLQALALAKKNAAHNKVTIEFIHSDLFTDIPNDLTFDIIISNPPYISPQEWRSLDASVRNWEDNMALIAPENGLGLLKEIICNAPKYLTANTALQSHNICNLNVEMGHKQGSLVTQLFEEAGYNHILVQKDLFGNDRLVSGYFDARHKEN